MLYEYLRKYLGIYKTKKQARSVYLKNKKMLHVIDGH